MEEWRNVLERSAISPFVRYPAISTCVLFQILALAWTWPLPLHAGTRIAHDPGDPVLNTWILWWNAHAVPFTAAWWNPPFLYPLRGALALSEHLAGLGLISTPVQIAGGGPLLAYNVALVLSGSLSGFFAFLLVRRISGSGAAALFAGVAYGFAPYRAGQLAHLQVLSSEWLPLALLGLHEYLDSGRRRGLAVFAGAWIVQSLSNGYYLLFFPVLLALWLAWFVDWRNRPRRGAVIVIAWLAASLSLAPILWKYHVVQGALGLSRTLEDMRRFSATPLSLLRASPLLAFWPSMPGRTEEDYLFPGITVVLAIIISLVIVLRQRTRSGSPDRSPLLFYCMAAVVMYALALGPAPARAGITALLHPYSLLASLPGYEGLRTPARFAMFGVLCLSTAGGLALRIILARLGRGRAAALTVAAFIGLFADCWMKPMPLAGPPGRLLLPELPFSAVLELPADDAAVNVAAMYRAMFHRRPLINGYTGYAPPHYSILSTGLRRGDPSVVFELARGRPLVLVVSDRSGSSQEWKRYVEELPGVERHGAGSGGLVYVLPAQPATRVPPPGPSLQTVITQTAPERIEVDLGTERTARAVAFPLRWHYPELGERMAVEASPDRSSWSTVWEDWTGGPALAAALADPVRVPVHLVLPDVKTRYLRIHPAPRWLARELTVEGPG